MADPRNPVNWFEIPVTDIERARDFYQHLLQVQLTPQDMGHFQMAWFPMVDGAYGTTGTLMQAESYEPSHKGSMVYFSVDDIEAALDRAVEKGGKVLNPKMSIGEHGFVAHLEDSEGNRVALHATT